MVRNRLKLVLLVVLLLVNTTVLGCSSSKTRSLKVSSDQFTLTLEGVFRSDINGDYGTRFIEISASLLPTKLASTGHSYLVDLYVDDKSFAAANGTILVQEKLVENVGYLDSSTRSLALPIGFYLKLVPPVVDSYLDSVYSSPGYISLRKSLESVYRDRTKLEDAKSEALYNTFVKGDAPSYSTLKSFDSQQTKLDEQESLLENSLSIYYQTTIPVDFVSKLRLVVKDVSR